MKKVITLFLILLTIAVISSCGTGGYIFEDSTGVVVIGSEPYTRYVPVPYVYYPRYHHQYREPRARYHREHRNRPLPPPPHQPIPQRPIGHRR